ncbi:MAG: protein kinase [Alphaproteobacteria bacterium]|nr:protein kinase [Alphaproteobacteria bacterium]
MRGVLGRGGMAVVFEVEHVPTGELRALKLLHGDAGGEEALQRFSAEFRTLSQLDHPNITRVYESGLWRSRAWFAMERLEGQVLRDAIESWRGLSPTDRYARAESVLRQVADALAYVHDRGLVHRDVTPGNVMLSPQGDAKLMDFGVVHTPGTDLTTVGEMVGTVAYIAPEQISAEVGGGRVDARTDLYALGVVLYQMLVGRRPFNATTIPGLLEKHLSARPRPPRELQPTVPRTLNDICMRLLEKQPAQRFGSARHLLSVLDAQRRRRVDMRRWPPTLVGRTSEQTQLREALSVLAGSGRGGAILLEGAAGHGKSRMLDDLIRAAREMGVSVAGGSCVSDLASYSGFIGVLDSLMPEGVPTPPTLEAFRSGGGELEPYAVMVAFRDLLIENAPVLVTIDNVERADRGTQNLLEYLLRNLLHLSQEAVLFVMARLPPEGEDRFDALLHERSAGVELTRVDLGPIPDTAVEELLLQLVPADDRSRRLARRLHREGEGNPLFISEMIRGLVEEGVIREVDELYALELEPAEVERTTLPIPSTIRGALKERLSHLSQSAVQVASVIALCQQEVTFDILLETLGAHEDHLMEEVEELVDHGVIRGRFVGVDELFDLSQPRLRDILTEGLEPDERVTLHRRLGAALERLYRQRIPSVVETVAYHFERGEMPGKAYPYLVRAGVRARERSFVAEALNFFDRALLLEQDAREYLILEDADRQLAELYIQRGLALFHLGRWKEAEACFRRAETLALEIQDERMRARALTELGTFARRQHRIAEAEDHLTEALTIANRLGDQTLRVSPLNALGAVRWYRGDMEGAREYWLEALGTSGHAQQDEALGEGYLGLGLVYFCRGQAAEARKYFEQSAHVFEKLGKLGRLAVTRVNLVELYHCMGNLRKGVQLADRTISQARETSHVYGIALGLRYRSMLLLDLGRVAEAEENALEALRIVQEIHNPEEELAVHISLIRVALAHEDYERVRALLDAADPLAERFDTEGFRPILYAWRARLHALQGDRAGVDAALSQSQALAGRPWPHQQCRLELITARALLAAGRSAEALDHAEEALRSSDSAGFRFYSLKAHVLIARSTESSERVKHHDRVAHSLARSLSANLTREDSETFMTLNQVPGQTHRLR